MHMTSAHKNLILLKQEYNQVAFLVERVEIQGRKQNPESGNACIVSADI